MTAPHRGYKGNGGGAAAFVEAPPEFVATSAQLAGLFPFSVGSTAPTVGTPIGRDLYTGTSVCCDPLSWFTRSQLLATPTVLVVGSPGRGKSSLLTRWTIGFTAAGVVSIIADVKGEHVAVIEALGGNVVRLGRGTGSLNVLDPGPAMVAAHRLTGEPRRRLIADSLARRLNTLGGLIELNRRGPVTETEQAVLVAALRVLDTVHSPANAVLADLIALLEEGPEEIRRVTLARASDRRYRQATDGLASSVLALTEGALGDVFARRTSVEIAVDRPLCLDLSSIGESDTRLAAATLLAAWSAAFSAIDAAHSLADAGLAPPRNFFVALEELWRIVGRSEGGDASEHMAARVNALTRLNRQSGTALALVTHSVNDLSGGLAERAAFVVAFGMPASEVTALDGIVELTQRERALLTSWSSPPSWSADGTAQSFPGRGKCLIKVGGKGIACSIELTPAERALHDTNQRFEMKP